MKERPILFSGPMVRAILDGRKTQTRRLLNPQPPTIAAVKARSGSGFSIFTDHHAGFPGEFRVAGPVSVVRDLVGRTEWKCPHGAPGDRLWVKETFFTLQDGIFYRATDPGWDENKPLTRVTWKSPYFMRRIDSRITLEVTDVRVERLHEITDEEAKAEGARFKDFGADSYGQQLNGWSCEDPFPASASGCLSSPRWAFASLWNQINGKRQINGEASAWESDPWVWVETFKVVETQGPTFTPPAEDRPAPTLADVVARLEALKKDVHELRQATEGDRLLARMRSNDRRP